MRRHADRLDTALLDRLKFHLSTCTPAIGRGPRRRGREHIRRIPSLEVAIPRREVFWFIVLGLLLYFAREAYGVPLWLILAVICSVVLELLSRFLLWYRTRLKSRDVRAAALAMVNHYGADAIFQASVRSYRRLEDGDALGAANWDRILDAIERLQAKARAEGATAP